MALSSQPRLDLEESLTGAAASPTDNGGDTIPWYSFAGVSRVDDIADDANGHAHFGDERPCARAERAREGFRARVVQIASGEIDGRDGSRAVE